MGCNAIMRSVRRTGAILLLAFARAALAQRAGDPTPDSAAPVVVVVDPMDGGVVGTRLRVQARVQHPAGLGAVTGVSLSATGATVATVPLARNASYALAGGAGMYEAIVTLARGASTLVATATDGAGRSTTSAPVAIVANAAAGDGDLLARDDSSQLCSACHANADHGSETAGRAYGAWTTTCRDCHAPHGTRNLRLVRETIRPPWVTGPSAPVPAPVRFARRTGYAAAGGAASWSEASFANGDGTGPCQVCHTRTVRWRGGGAAADAIHLGDCGFCHRHPTGLKARCEDCHPTPPATGAHAAHHGASAPSPPFPSDPRPLGCGSCHPTDPTRHGDGAQQIVLNADLVLPGGTRTTGAQLGGAAGSPSCLVACHHPLGAPTPAQPVSWSTVGPLPCTSCHARIAPRGEPTPRAGPTLHDPIFGEARPASGEQTTCWSCHAEGDHDATHLTGSPGLAPTTDATCIHCHTPPSGPATGDAGQVLHRGDDAVSSRTPPPFPGWSTSVVDSTSGDFHGGRRGTCFDSYRGPVPCAPGVTPTGYGGTLLAPYSRGYPPMPCATCHAGHESGNAFLLAGAVNGTAIPPGSVDRTGVGAERLCEACHAGGRHDRCKQCHVEHVTWVCDANAICWWEGPPADPAPAGSGCFFCHGHEGIIRWTEPYSGGSMSGGMGEESCRHCHGFAMPAVNYAPPAFTTYNGGAPTVARITGSSANVSWGTDEASSSWVEYGVGLPGWVAGSAAEVYAHTVTLTGLSPGTTYVWRVRSVDAYRNAVRTDISTFTTTPPGVPPYPDIVPVGWTGVPAPQTTMQLPLRWYPVSAPTGNAVEYRVQLASDTTFTTLLYGSPPDSGWIPGTPGVLNGQAILSFTVTLTDLPIDQCGDVVPSNEYSWRVKARDAVTGAESDWSAVDPFQATSYDPWGC